jgi:AraC family transcriptional regulator, positive regulator of tynA and feaB
MATISVAPMVAPLHEQERFSAGGGAMSGRLAAWSDILADTHVAFDVRATSRTPHDFRGIVRRRRFGQLALVDCAASPFSGHRGPGLIDESPDGRSRAVLGLQLVCRGVEKVKEGARELALTSGDIVLWDGQQTTSIEVVEPFYKRTLMFPRELALSVCPRLAEQTALPPLGDSAPARLLVRFMNAVAAELPGLDEVAGAAAANAAVELLRAAVEPSLPATRATTRAAMRADIRQYVRTHLQDPALGPASIARAHAISVRALHALFEDTEESVAGLVRRERLARCHEDLEHRGGGSVTSIAFRWGFCDAAHFSRVFKQAYGVTPSEVRQAALERDR